MSDKSKDNEQDRRDEDLAKEIKRSPLGEDSGNFVSFDKPIPQEKPKKD